MSTPTTPVRILDIASGDVLVLDKIYGPTVFADLRITADPNRGWVIERAWIDTGEWVEWCVVPMQFEREFSV